MSIEHASMKKGLRVFVQGAMTINSEEQWVESYGIIMNTPFSHRDSFIKVHLLDPKYKNKIYHVPVGIIYWTKQKPDYSEIRQ